VPVQWPDSLAVDRPTVIAVCC